MELPLTATEATLICTAILAVAFYLGHHFGIKEGALGMFEFLRDNGHVDIVEEIIEVDEDGNEIEKSDKED